MALCKVDVCWLEHAGSVLIALVHDPACNCDFYVYSEASENVIQWKGDHPLHGCLVLCCVDGTSTNPLKLVCEIPDKCNLSQVRYFRIGNRIHN